MENFRLNPSDLCIWSLWHQKVYIRSKHIQTSECQHSPSYNLCNDPGNSVSQINNEPQRIWFSHEVLTTQDHENLGELEHFPNLLKKNDLSWDVEPYPHHIMILGSLAEIINHPNARTVLRPHCSQKWQDELHYEGDNKQSTSLSQIPINQRVSPMIVDTGLNLNIKASKK